MSSRKAAEKHNPSDIDPPALWDEAFVQHVLELTEAFLARYPRSEETLAVQARELRGISSDQLRRLRQKFSPETESRQRAIKQERARKREMEEIIALILDWAGSKAKAERWYRTERLPAFGGLTAENLVELGKADQVREFIGAITVGEFA